MAEAPCTSLYEKGLEDLGDEITCPICQDHFQEPKILPCLHYYCKECIRNLARRHNPFPCPECRRDTTLPQNDPDQLQTAFFVNRMKEVHTKMEKADGKVKAMCEMCSGEEAEAFCRQCTYFICADCVRSHKKMKVFAAHQVVTLVELKQGGARQIPINEAPPTLCKEHDEPMKIFCFDCNRLICRDCVIDGHTDHKREFIKKYAVQCQSMVTESLTPLKRIQADMKQCTKTIESTEADVSTQHATVSKTIRQSFAKIVSIIKQREQQLLDKASAMRDQKLDALGAQKKNLQIVQAESQSLIEFVEHSLEGATDEEVISIYQQILPRVEEESKRHKKISRLPTTGGKLAVEISYSSDELLKIGRVYDIIPLDCSPSKAALTYRSASKTSSKSERKERMPAEEEYWVLPQEDSSTGPWSMSSTKRSERCKACGELGYVKPCRVYQCGVIHNLCETCANKPNCPIHPVAKRIY